jgi:diguanylate cyclase (GGDEF)-like protein
MPAAVSQRTFLIATSLVSYAVIFAAFLYYESPGLGIGHFYYASVVLLALETGMFWGIAGGVLADVLYSGGILLNPHIPSAQILSTSMGIRFLMYTMMGGLVGWFAQRNRLLVNRLQLAADRDFLTGLLNARAFDSVLEERLTRNRPFGLVMGDIDDLKDVNDQEGHAVGNDLLRRAGEVLATLLREGDELARVGGDEFAILTDLPGTDAVRALCSRLSRALAEDGMRMSFGWAVYPRDGEDSLTLFRAADERLYAQKLIRSRMTHAEIVQLQTEQQAPTLRQVL